MKMFKSLLLSLIVVLVFSCKQEELLDQNQNTGGADLSTDISQYDNSNLGLYKGTFTTLDASERGVLEVKILPNLASRATLSLSTGATFVLESKTVVGLGEDTNLSFANIADTEKDITFDLSVNANGTNILITNTNFGSRASHIIAAKETSRVPVVPIPGTFKCTSCGTTSWAGPQTFNVLFTGDPSGSGTMDTDFTLNGTTFSSVGTMDNNQSGCVPNGAYTDCTIVGSTDIDSKILSWSGIHKYDSSIKQCSQVNGTWSYESPTFGSLAGTFSSDNQCLPPVNDECSGAIEVFNGTNLSCVNATATTGTGNPAIACGGVTPGASSGLWYTLSDPGLGTSVTIDTAGSNYDTIITVYTDGCGTLTCVAGNDDFDGNLYSRVSFPTIPSVTTDYLILVTQYDPDPVLATETSLNVVLD